MRVALAGAALAVLGWAAAAPGNTLAPCKPGAHMIGGGAVRTFCGQAKAFMGIHTVDYQFDSGGRCTRTGGTFRIDIGTVTLRPGAPKSYYFGIAVRAAHDGTYRNQTVRWQLPGTRGSLTRVTVKLSKGLREGSFSGFVPGGGPGSGTFFCSS